MAGPNLDVKTPKFKLPAGAVDTHCHLMGPGSKYPYRLGYDDRDWEAPIEDLLKVHDSVGIDRAVLVHPYNHGTDNSVVLDAMAANPGRFRGVALVDDDITDQELEALDAAGMRGVRYAFVERHGGPPDMKRLSRMADRIKSLNWHLVLHLDEDSFLAHADGLENVSVPRVFDHMADLAPGLDQPASQRLLKFLAAGDSWVKISGIDKRSAQPYPHADTAAFRASFVEAAPDRVLWGTDWPHPNPGPFGRPDDGDLVDLVPSYTADPDVQRKLLVENPGELYGFD